MIEYLPGIKKVAFRVLWVSLVITILLLLRYNKTYFENKFTISLNGTNIIASYDSDYREVFLVNESSSGYTDTISGSKDLFYEVDKSDKYILDFHEYESYDKFDKRVSYNSATFVKRFEEVKSSDNKLKIERLGKVLYDDVFISDISNIINEEGRYYFHIYNTSKRNVFLTSNVKTFFHFSVLVRDYNED